MTANPPEGWYTDPHDATGLRYWDGSTWTEHTHRADAAAQAPAAAAAAAPVAPSEQAPAGYASPNQDVQATQPYGVAPAQAYGSYELNGTPVGEEPKSGMGTGAKVGIIVGAVVILLALIGIIVLALNSGDDDTATNDDPTIVDDGTASPDDTTDGATDDGTTTEDEPADEADSAATGTPVIPDGWEVIDSPSGAITYAHDPDMSDAGEFIDLDTLDDQLSSALPGSSSEVSGMWVDVSATATAGSSVMLMTMGGGALNPDSLSTELEAFAQSASAGAEGIEVGDTTEFVTAVGYDAARLDYSSTSMDVTSYATVTAVVDGDVAVFVFASSTSDAESAALLDQQAVDSLVINHAP